MGEETQGVSEGKRIRHCRSMWILSPRNEVFLSLQQGDAGPDLGPNGLVRTARECEGDHPALRH